MPKAIITFEVSETELIILIDVPKAQVYNGAPPLL